MRGIVVIIILVMIWKTVKRSNNKGCDVRIIRSNNEEKMKKEIRAYRKLLSRQYKVYDQILDNELSLEELRQECFYLQRDIDELMRDALYLGGK